MRKTICNIEYDTERAVEIYKKTSGNHGDPEGYEECLYRTEDGRYFLYTNGGEKSKYSEENIKRMSRERAEAWLSETKNRG
ncbi:MAG: hypothetical protein J6Q68_03085 [Clostridia bacterium]|nr:hypothetical protein [Clostridia bacterium]